MEILYWNEPALPNADAIANLFAANNNVPFKLKQKTTCKTAANGIKDIVIMVPLKHLCNLWKTLEVPSIICEINLILTLPEKYMLSYDTKAISFAITDTKLYVPAITLSIQENAKLFQQLKSGSERTIN